MWLGLRQRDQSDRPHRRSGARMVGAILALLTLATALWAWQGVLSAEQVVEIRLDGIACGSHLALKPGWTEVKPGTRVRFVNRSIWSHQLRIVQRDSVSAPPVAQSKTLPPGGEWEVRLWRSGQYFVVPDNQWHYLAGLKGRLVVQR